MMETRSMGLTADRRGACSPPSERKEGAAHMRLTLTDEDIAKIKAVPQLAFVASKIDEERVRQAKYAPLIEKARKLYYRESDPEQCNVDADAQFSPAPEDHGVWVQAWVWVPDDD